MSYTSDAEICNAALSFIGDSTTIQDLETETSAQAKACRMFYETTRDEELADFPWTFAKQSMELTLVEEEPNDDWSFSYRRPASALTIRRIWGAVRNPTLTQTIKYDIGSDSTGQLIYTDMEEAEIEFTARIEDVSKWPPLFAIAVAYKIASRIAMRLAKEDKFGMSERMMFAYELAVSKARAKNENERRPDAPPDSEIITSRGGY